MLLEYFKNEINKLEDEKTSESPYISGLDIEIDILVKHRKRYEATVLMRDKEGLTLVSTGPSYEYLKGFEAGIRLIHG